MCGDPACKLRWSRNSAPKLAAALTALGHLVSDGEDPPVIARPGLPTAGDGDGDRGQRPPGPRCPVYAHQDDRIQRLATGETVISMEGWILYQM